MGGDASSGKAGEVRGGVETGGASSGSGRVRDKGSDIGLFFGSEGAVAGVGVTVGVGIGVTVDVIAGVGV